jgi:hypothetical protein
MTYGPVGRLFGLGNKCPDCGHELGDHIYRKDAEPACPTKPQADVPCSAATEQPRGMEPILNSLMQATLDVTTTSRPALRKRFEEILRGQVRDAAQAAPTPVVWRVRYCGQWMYFEDKGNAEIYAQGDDNTEPLYAAQPPAAPVEPYIYGSDGRSDAVETDADLPTYQDVRGILPRSSAGNEHPVLEQADKLNDLGFKAGWLGAIDEAEKMMLRWSAEAKEFEQDSERCKIQGNVCRNAATAIRNLAKLVPDEPQEALRYAATKAVEAYRRAQSEGEVVIAMENLERALSPDEPRRSVTRPEGKPHG